MDNEELERKMEFIVEQQAQSVARTGILEDIVARLGSFTLGKLEDVDEKFRDVDERISALVDSQIRFSDTQARHEASLNEKMNALVDAQIRLDESHSRLAESHLRLTES